MVGKFREESSPYYVFLKMYRQENSYLGHTPVRTDVVVIVGLIKSSCLSCVALHSYIQYCGVTLHQ